MRRLATAAMTTVLLLPLLVGLTTAPSYADFGGGSPDGTQNGIVGSCYASAGPNYLGLRCLGGSSSGESRLTPEQLLCALSGRDQPYTAPTPAPEGPYKPNAAAKPGCDPVPTCWDAPVQSDEQASLGLYNVEGPPKITYFWFRCLRNIDASMTVKGVVDVTQYPVGKGNGDRIFRLSKRQQDLIDVYGQLAENENAPPDPKPVASPSSNPRVGFKTSFYDGNPSTVTVNAGGVILMAREEWIQVRPTGEGTTEYTTPGRCVRQNGGFADPTVRVGYEAKKGDTPETVPSGTNDSPGGCWYEYTRSSADRPGDVYQAQARSHWRVYSSQDGGNSWQRFQSLAGNEVEFDKLAENQIYVTEIQAINYLPVTGAKP